MKRLSIKLKVTIWYTLAMVIISAIVLVAMNSLGHGILERDMTGRIVQTVNDTSKKLVDPSGRVHHIRGFELYDRGIAMILYDGTHNVIAGEPPFDAADSVKFDNDVVRTSYYDGSKYFEYDKEIRVAGTEESFWLKGIMSAEEGTYIVRSVTKNNIIFTALMIILAAIGGYIIVSRALVPVEKIRKTAKKISENRDFSQRIKLGSGKDEIYALADTFDEMLDRIEAAFEMEKQFTSDASHELRTPIAVILSECEYIEACAKTPQEFKEAADSVKRQADRMSRLVSELLTISRMDKQTLNTSLEEVDLSELVSFICDEQQEIQREDIELVRIITPDITATADRFLLTRAMINLISNAYQYIGDGSRIEVTLDEDDENIVFAVKDDGIGIEKEQLDKIWERFYQADAARSRSENGSMGLGLSMVKWIVSTHGGKTFAESEIGKGSRIGFAISK